MAEADEMNAAPEELPADFFDHARAAPDELPADFFDQQASGSAPGTILGAGVGPGTEWMPRSAKEFLQGPPAGQPAFETQPRQLPGGGGEAYQQSLETLKSQFPQEIQELPPLAHVTSGELGTLIKGALGNLGEAMSAGMKGIRNWAENHPTVAGRLNDALSRVRATGVTPTGRRAPGTPDEAARLQSEPSQAPAPPDLEAEKQPMIVEPVIVESGAAQEIGPPGEAPAPVMGRDMGLYQPTTSWKQAGTMPRDELNQLVNQAAEKHGVDPLLVNALVEQESRGKPGIIGPETKYGRAHGLTQLLVSTAKEMGLEEADIHDPGKNLDAGVKYLKKMLDRYDGDEYKALAAYNYGPRRVPVEGRMPKLPEETANYIVQITHHRNQQLAALKSRAPAG